MSMNGEVMPMEQTKGENEKKKGVFEKVPRSGAGGERNPGGN